MSDPEVSIIIPVYNSEKYLHQCIDSVLAQTFSDFEIIFVDDGSTDASCEVISGYASTEKRMKFVRQENQGAGVARNVGLDCARGAYIMFLDSDDWFDVELISKMLRCIKSTNSDICICEAWNYDDVNQTVYEGCSISNVLPEIDCLVTKNMPLHFDLFNISYEQLWLKMYRHNFLKEKMLRCQGIMRDNDTLLNIAALAESKRIALLRQRLIYWRIRRQESSMSTASDYIGDYLASLVVTRNELIRRGVYKRFKNSYDHFVIKHILFHLEDFLAISPSAFYDLYALTRKNGNYASLGLAEISDRCFSDNTNFAEAAKLLASGTTEQLANFIMNNELQLVFHKAHEIL
jgi:glycosyltransferase involved in cell wall biosynthesis